MKNLDKPQIKSYKRFREAVRIGAVEYGFGYSERNYSLYYRFDVEMVIKGVKNLKEAYNKYKRKFKSYDKYISENSFLRG